MCITLLGIKIPAGRAMCCAPGVVATSDSSSALRCGPRASDPSCRCSSCEPSRGHWNTVGSNFHDVWLGASLRVNRGGSPSFLRYFCLPLPVCGIHRSLTHPAFFLRGREGLLGRGLLRRLSPFFMRASKQKRQICFCRLFSNLAYKPYFCYISTVKRPRA